MTSEPELVKVTLETRGNAIHIIAGAMYDYSFHVKVLQCKSQDFLEDLEPFLIGNDRYSLPPRYLPGQKGL